MVFRKIFSITSNLYFTRYVGISKTYLKSTFIKNNRMTFLKKIAVGMLAMHCWLGHQELNGIAWKNVNLTAWEFYCFMNPRFTAFNGWMLILQTVLLPAVLNRLIWTGTVCVDYTVCGGVVKTSRLSRLHGTEPLLSRKSEYPKRHWWVWTSSII